MLRTVVPYLVVLAVALSSAGCPSSPGPDTSASAPAAHPPEAPTPPAASEGVAVTERVLPVKCGCKLEAKKCSEWAELDGQWIQLAGEHGMGSMPFCGKEGLKARISGQVEGGKLHLTTIKMVP